MKQAEKDYESSPHETGKGTRHIIHKLYTCTHRTLLASLFLFPVLYLNSYLFLLLYLQELTAASQIVNKEEKARKEHQKKVPQSPKRYYETDTWYALHVYHVEN